MAAVTILSAVRLCTKTLDRISFTCRNWYHLKACCLLIPNLCSVGMLCQPYWRTLLLFCIIFYMVFNQLCRSLSHDALLVANNLTRHVVHNWVTRDVIARLHLRRQGCRADEHCHRQLAAAKLVTSSVNCVDKGIPTILGNRRHANKPHQVQRESHSTVRCVIK